MSDLYQLPNGWEWEKLNNLTEVNIGKTPKRSKKEFFLGDKVWLSIRDLKGDYVSDSNEKLTDEAIKDSNIKIVPKGTLLMSFKLTLGRTAFADCDLYTNEAIASLPIKDESVLDKYFLKYSIGVIDLEKEVDNAVKGKTLNKQKIKNLDIPIPPLAEQQRIVSKLDTLFTNIDKAIALHQKNMDEADVFMGSVLNEVFGELEEKYPSTKVSDGLKKILTGTTPPKKEEKYYENPSINWFSPSDFGKSKVLSESKNMINPIALTDKKAKIYEKDTLLLVAIGATVGKIGVIREEASSNQQITAMKFKDDIDVDFSYYWFYYIKQTIINTASAATLPIINQNGIKDLKFIYPPLQTQQKVVKYLDNISQKIEKVKRVQKEKMDSLHALKASILDRAFRGEL